MIVQHCPDGRTLLDTQGLAAITGRTPWTIRAHAHRDPTGLYDHDASLPRLAEQPEPVLLNATQAQLYLGLRAGTIRSWASRGRIRSLDTDRGGRPLYDLADLIDLATPTDRGT